MKRWRSCQELIEEADWHIHTTYTDGHSSIDEYCKQALERGLKSIAFTEHVRRDLKYDFYNFLRDIESAKKCYPLRIFSGCETKIIDSCGGIDATEPILRGCDVVIGVFHSFPIVNKEHYLKSVIALLNNPFVQIWGHPTLCIEKQGILLEPEDIEKIASECLKNDVVVERNMKYKVPNDSFIKHCRLAGVQVVVSSDAHNAKELLDADSRAEEWRRLEYLGTSVS